MGEGTTSPKVGTPKVPLFKGPQAFYSIENSFSNFDDKKDRCPNERDILVSSKNPNLTHYTVTAPP